MGKKFADMKNVVYADSLGEVISRAIKMVVIWVTISFLSLTGVASLVWTTYLPDYNYRVSFSVDNGLFIFFVSILVILSISLLLYFGIFEKIRVSVLFRCLFVYVLLMGLGWIALTHVWPEWDSYDTFFVARGLNNPSLMPNCEVPSDETWAACPNGAMERYPYQLPLMFVFRIINWIFGEGDYLAVEIMNVFLTAISFCLLGKISNEIFGNENIVKMTLLLCFAFLPQIFYVTFAYGNTLSLPFVLMAILLQCRSLREGDFRLGIASSFSVVIAILLKSTMVYVFIAMMITWGIALIRKFHWRELICVFVAFVLFACSGLVISAIGDQSGYETDKGLPKIVWIAMGLQKPSKDMPDNAGWYNGYPASWPADGYNPKQAESDSADSIRQSISDFTSDPGYAIAFFGRKFLSEWTEPTYESLLASNWSSGRADRPAMSERSMSVVLHSAYYGRIHQIILTITDTLQFLLLGGAAIALLRYRRQLHVYYLNIIMIPFGVAILYLLWEAQAQYIMPAYIMMIPLAGAGIIVVGQHISGRLEGVAECCMKVSGKS